ncbi:MAG TPA: acyltransferase [Gemmatimonadaceae bacterium]|nr:acyltransferase [Gemmatimonadaceae bacterium]
MDPHPGQRLKPLDGLRGIAILGVLLFHGANSLARPATIGGALVRKLFSSGWTGVDLFFVLSGFLITGILLDAKGRPNYFRAFYARRALRILPLYYGYLLAIFIVGPLLAGHALGLDPTPASDQAWYWVHLQNFHFAQGSAKSYVVSLWSLAIEEQFYLLWPAVILLCSERGALRACIACIALSFAYRAWMLAAVGDPHPLYFGTPARLDGLAVGRALAIVARTPDGLKRLRPYVRPTLVASALLLLIVFVRARYLNPADTVLAVAGYPALAAAFGAILVWALTPGDGWAHRALSGPMLGFWGKYSYGLYVLHGAVQSMAAVHGITASGFLGMRVEWLSVLAYMACMLAASTVLALLSWHAWEKPFHKLRRRFPYGRVAVAGAAGAAASVA